MRFSRQAGEKARGLPKKVKQSSRLSKVYLDQESFVFFFKYLARGVGLKAVCSENKSVTMFRKDTERFMLQE